MSLFVLAELLHKGVYELGDMPNSEVVEWIAYLRIKQRASK